MNNSTPISRTTNEQLYQVLEIKLGEYTKAIDLFRNLLRKVDGVENALPNLDLESRFFKYKRLIEYQLLLGIINLDLITSIRIYLKANYKYESLFSARQVHVIITEGLKKIYHFKEEERKDTFWIKDIGRFIENEELELKNEYEKITNKLKDYISQYYQNKTIKDIRDYSVHYDTIPSNVYDMIIKLDVDTSFRFMIPFLDITNSMFVFNQQIITIFKKKEEKESEKIRNSLTEIFNKVQEKALLLNIDKNITDKFEELIKKINSDIMENKKPNT